MTQGPTNIMRQEHTQMRGLLDQMKLAVDAADGDELREKLGEIG